MSEKAWLSAVGGRGGYARPLPEPMLVVEQEALGTQLGVRGYTTPAQVKALGRALRLRPGKLLLDLGSGRGWPSLQLMQDFGCRAVLTDLPAEGLGTAAERARDWGLGAGTGFARVHAAHLPFPSATFDAVSSTDVLC